MKLCVRLIESDWESDVDPKFDAVIDRVGSNETLWDMLLVEDCSHDWEGVADGDNEIDKVKLRLIVWDVDFAEAVTSEERLNEKLGSPERVRVRLCDMVFEEETSFVIDGPDLVGDSDKDID